MAHILFVTWDGGGNVPPALGLAEELATRGHDVEFLGHAQQEAAIPFAFRPFSAGRPFDALVPGNPRTYVQLFGDRGIGEDVLAVPADLYVVDCVLFGAMDALRRAGRPYVVLEHLYDSYLRRHWMRGPMGLAMRAKRLRPTRSLDGAQACLAATLAELDRGTDPRVIHTGPVVTGAPARADQPTVLVSLSTCNYPGQHRVLQTILDAVAGLPARVVVTTGAMQYPGLRVPDGVEVHGYAPHGEILPTISMVVGHGGHATTMAALAHDLPLLIIPMHPMLDQPLVGRSVQEAGAGLTLPKRSAAPAIRAAIERLLDEEHFREGAARLGAAIRAADGPRTGADAVERAVDDDRALSGV